MLEDKAKELGRLIGQSAEYKAVKRANDELAADREAVALLRELEKLREDAQSMIGRAESDHHAGMSTSRGRLIVLEGQESAGKSTQAPRLVRWLGDRGIDAILV